MCIFIREQSMCTFIRRNVQEEKEGKYIVEVTHFFIVISK